MGQAEDLFASGISDFFFTEFGAFGESLAGCNVHELVHSPKGRGVLGSGERGADAKSIDLGSSGKQIGDDEFVEVTAGEDEFP